MWWNSTWTVGSATGANRDRSPVAERGRGRGMRLRTGSLAVIAALCIAAGAGQGQYVEDSIQGPGAWVGSLVYVPEQDEVWGSSRSASTVFAISCDSNRIVATIPVHWAGKLAYDSIDGKLYCEYYGPGQESLAVISVSTRQVVRRLEMPGSSVPVWDAASNRVYVSCQATNSVAVVDCATDSLLTYIPVGDCPIKLYINTLRRKLYVLNYDDYSVSVVDMATNQVTKTIGVGEIPNAGYYCRRVDKFYCGRDNEVVVLDGYTDSVAARIPVAEHSTVDAVSGSDERDVVVASAFTGEGWLYAIDAGKDTVNAVVKAGRSMYAIHWSPLSDRFYCTTDFTNEVIVLSGDGRQHLASLPVANYPFVIAESPIQKRLYIGHLGSSKVYVIRDATTPWPEGQPSKPDTVSGVRLDPNPFRDRLSIASGTKVAAGHVGVYSEDGRLVRSLNATKTAGCVLRLTWDGRDSRGRSVSPGVYVVTAPGGVRAKAVKLK